MFTEGVERTSRDMLITDYDLQSLLNHAQRATPPSYRPTGIMAGRRFAFPEG